MFVIGNIGRDARVKNACSERWQEPFFRVCAGLSVILRFPAIGLILALSLIDAAVCHANAGPYRTYSPIVGEPMGLTNIVITREDLELDFRPLQDFARVKVHATYQLRNQTGAEALRLAFIFGSAEHTNHKITLNGQTLQASLGSDSLEFARKWAPPKSTPGLDSEKPLGFNTGGGKPVLFDVEIPEGMSVLSVSYEEDPAYLFSRPAMYRQFAYILSPAKAWAGFNDLNVRLLIPSGWDAKTNLSLVQDGDALVGQFDSLPDDSIAVTLRPPVPPIYTWIKQRQFLIGSVIVLITTILVWRRGTTVFMRKMNSVQVEGMPKVTFGESLMSILLRSLSVALVVGFTTFMVTLGLDVVFPMEAAEEKMRRTLRIEGGYAQAFLFILCVFLTVAGFFISVAAGCLQYINLVAKIKKNGSNL